MSQLTHPNTVKVFMFGRLDRRLSLYIIMEFLEGKNLNQTVRADGPFPMERGLPVLIAACGALDEAHRAGIIHRDLKPENIFLVQSGTFKDLPEAAGLPAWPRWASGRCARGRSSSRRRGWSSARRSS